MAEREEIIKIVAVNAARQAYQSVIADQKLLSQAVVQGNQQQVGAVRNFTAELAKARSEVAGLSAVQRAQIDAGLKVGASYKDIAQSVGVSNLALREYRGQAAGAAQGTGLLTSGLGTLRTLLPGLTLVGVAAGLKAMATEAFDAADRLVTLNNKTGISLEQLQRMEFVAGQTGVEFEALSQGSFKLGVNLQATGAKGDKVKAALNEIGQSVERVRALKPEQRWDEVIASLEKVEDVQRRNALGMAIFGTQYTEFAAAVNEGYSAIARNAKISSDAEIQALEAAGDKWDRFVRNFKTGVRSVLASMVGAMEEIERGADSMTSGHKAWLFLTKGAGGYREELQRVGRGLIESEAAEKAAEEARKKAAQATGGATTATADYVKELAAARTEVAGLSAEHRTQLNAALKLGGEAAETYADKIGLSETALRLFSSQSKESKKDTLDLFGGDVLKKALDYQRALGSIENASKLTTAKKKELHQAVTAALEVYRALGREAPQALRDIAAATQDVLTVTRAFSADTRFWVPLKAAIADTRDELLLLADSIDDAARRHAAAKGVVGGLWVPLKEGVQDVRSDIHAAAAATSDWTDQISILAGGFAQLGQISGGVMGSILGGIGQIFGMLDLGNRAAAGSIARGKAGGFNVRNLGVATDLFAKGSTKGERFASGVASAAAIGQGAMDVWDATDNARSRGGNALGGMMAGAQAGAAFGPYGIAIGAAAGLVVGLIRGKPAWAKAADEVGRDFGVKISDGLAKEIEKVAKEKFKKDRQAASIFSLDQIIAEAGGVKPETLAKFTAKLHDAFSMREMGKFTQEQLTETVDKNFQALVDVAKQKGGLITSELREIMALNDRFGSNSVAISEHVKNSIGAGLTHLTTFLQLSAAAAKDNVGEIAKDVQKLEDERDRLTAGLRPEEDDPRSFERDKQRITEINQQIEDLLKKSEQAKALQQGLAITSTRSAGAFASAIAGSFQKLLAEGVDPMEAIGQVEPAVLALQGQLDKLGMDGGEAFQALRAQIAMTRDEVAGPMVSGIRSLGSSITELYNAGILTEDMFAGMTAQIGQTFQALVAQGHNGRTAMSLMKPQLQAIWELQQRFGTELDESTQKLLDEAEAAGIVGDKHKNASERMVDGIGKVVDRLDRLLVAMGVELPDAVDGAAREIENKARDMRERIGSIFDDIPDKLSVDVDVNATYNRREGTNTTQPGGETAPIPGAARGVYARRPMLRVFGEGGEPELGGPIEFMTRALQGALSRMPPDFSKEPAGKQPIEVILREVHNHPMLTITGFGLSVDEVVKINEQHLAQGGLMGNAGGSATLPGLREQIVDVVREVVRQELARA